MPASDVGQRKAASGRSWWWRIHRWGGLQVSWLLLFVMATGTIATIAPEIDWLLHPAMRVATRPGEQASWGSLLKAARTAVPGGAIESIEQPISAGFAVEAEARDAAGRHVRVQIDPWSAHVLGTTPWLSARRVLRDLHRHLLLPGWLGLPLVTLLSLPLAASFLTSFAVYRKWWRGYLRLPKPPRRASDRRRFTGDLHHWAGLWSLPFLVVMAVTGGWYLAEWGGLEQADPTPVGRCALFGHGLTVVANHRSRLSCRSGETHSLCEAASNSGASPREHTIKLE